MPTRTTHRSTSGTKLYAKGQITDIQTYKRAHGQDIQRSSQAERSKTSAKKSARKAVRKSARKSAKRASKKA